MQSATSLNMLEVTGLQANAIIQEMNVNFPPVQPHPQDSIEKIMYQAGQRYVVEWLIQRMEE